MAQTFEELISGDLDGLYSAALCFTQDQHRAEELLQETAVQAFHEFRSGGPESDFRVWMLEMLVARYLSRQRRRGTDPLAEKLDSMDDMGTAYAEADDVPFPEPGTKAYEWLRSWLERAWPQLDAGDRLVLWLATVERIRLARVAQMLMLDEEQVRRRHFRARRALSSGALRKLAKARFGSAEA